MQSVVSFIVRRIQKMQAERMAKTETKKATAASEGKTLTQFVIDIVERDVRRGGWTAPKPTPDASDSEGKRRKRKSADDQE